MSNTEDYIETEEEREEGHVDAREKTLNAKTKTRVWDAIPELMSQDNQSLINFNLNI
jgi:hypothetical protein